MRSANALSRRVDGAHAPRFRGLLSASSAASRTLSRVRSSGTRCEEALSAFLIKKRIRFQTNGGGLAGKPDFVFPRARVVVFCDGDFWHGRDWARRRRRLLAGHNAAYWVAKIRANIRRDRLRRAELRALGWTVLQFWESEILNATSDIGEEVVRRVRAGRKKVGPVRRIRS